MDKAEKNDSLMTLLESAGLGFPTQVSLDSIVLQNTFLPYIKLVDGKLKNQDDQLVSLETGFMVLSTRPMTRELSGKKYTNRFYPGGATNDQYLESLEKIKAQKKDSKSKIQEGFSSLLAYISDGKANIVSFELFSTGLAYWKPVFQKCEMKTGNIARLKFSDHTKYLKTSKEGNSYYAFMKSSDYEAMPISKEYKSLIKAAIQAQKEQIEKYYKA